MIIISHLVSALDEFEMVVNNENMFTSDEKIQIGTYIYNFLPLIEQHCIEKFNIINFERVNEYVIISQPKIKLDSRKEIKPLLDIIHLKFGKFWRSIVTSDFNNIGEIYLSIGTLIYYTNGNNGLFSKLKVLDDFQENSDFERKILSKLKPTII